MQTPDPPTDSPGASKQVVLTPDNIPRIISVFAKKWGWLISPSWVVVILGIDKITNNLTHTDTYNLSDWGVC